MIASPTTLNKNNYTQKKKKYKPFVFNVLVSKDIINRRKRQLIGESAYHISDKRLISRAYHTHTHKSKIGQEEINTWRDDQYH